jgi:putative ABC transport system permease protein
VAGFALLAVLLVAAISGLLPAWHVWRADLMVWLRTGRGVGGGRATTRARRTLIVAQVAVALALLVGTGLLVRSLERLHEVAPGFRSENVLAAEAQLPAARYEEPDRRVAFVEKVLERVSADAGVVSAGVISELPLSGAHTSGSFFVEGRERPEGEDLPHAELSSASPRYFAALGVGLRRGRLFDERDRQGRTPVVVVNEALVRRYYPGVDPIGKRVDYLTDPQDPQWHEIVGVVADVRDRGLDRPAEPHIYVPYAQRPEHRIFLVAHTAARDPLSALPVLRSAIREVDADQPLFGATTLERLVSEDSRERRAARAALAGFSVAAVLLATLGLYALLAQAARERVQEIGVRVALGARRSDVARLFLAEGSRLVAWGLLMGVGLALLATRLLRAFVYGVTTTDLPTYLAAAGLLSAVAILASAVPAWRASRADPVGALRSE